MVIFISSLMVVATNQSFIFMKTTLSAMIDLDRLVHGVGSTCDFRLLGPWLDGHEAEERRPLSVMRSFVHMLIMVGYLMIFDWFQSSLADSTYQFIDSSAKR
ncbi:hypothetical protein HCH54_001256 [Aspergillus fumigatus]